MKNDAKYPNGTESGTSRGGGNNKNWTPYLVGGIVGLLLVIFGMTHCWFGHSWNAASCTAPKTCVDCGKTEGNALGHTYTEATATAPKTCKLCGRTEGGVVTTHTHSWTEATCTAPKTCVDCGKTEGNALGHTYTEATVTAPKTCKLCGRTEGGVLPTHTHSWTEATCTSSQYCSACGETAGAALGHHWVDATYDAPKKCTRCGVAEGRSLGYPLTWRNDVGNSNSPTATTTVDVEEGDWKDCFGEYREDAVKFWVNASMVDTEHIVYDLSGEYSELVLTMVNAAENAKGGKNRVAVYADGVHIYQSDWITNDSRPVEQTLDVSSVKKLRIECDTDSYAHCYCLVQGLLYR